MTSLLPSSALQFLGSKRKDIVQSPLPFRMKRISSLMLKVALAVGKTKNLSSLPFQAIYNKLWLNEERNKAAFKKRWDRSWRNGSVSKMPSEQVMRSRVLILRNHIRRQVDGCNPTWERETDGPLDLIRQTVWPMSELPIQWQTLFQRNKAAGDGWRHPMTLTSDLYK